MSCGLLVLRQKDISPSVADAEAAQSAGNGLNISGNSLHGDFLPLAVLVHIYACRNVRAWLKLAYLYMITCKYSGKVVNLHAQIYNLQTSGEEYLRFIKKGIIKI